MNGDFTRLTFRPDNHYTSVRLQQGRLLLDADWNEQVDIDAFRGQTALQDTVGRTGAPLHAAGFALRSAPGSATTWSGAIGAGRFYVDGILCQNEFETLFSGQPDLPGAGLPTASGAYVAYLDVWQRHLSALEKPELLEVALGGPDTTTRTRTVWQVRLERVGEPSADLTCAAFGAEWAPRNSLSTGRLRARSEPSPSSSSVCLVPPGAGFRRLENQLYRVEIHTPAVGAGTTQPTTFKWSRENASVITRLQRLQVVARQGGEDTLLTVADAGRDPTRGFAAGNWVELIDEQRILSSQPGIVVRVSGVSGNRLTVSDWPTGVNRPDAERVLVDEWQVRRWDSANGIDTVRTGSPDQPVFLDLEDGVQVEFSGGEYHCGDYWLIPARSLVGDVDWPSVGDQPVFQRRHGVEHHYCALALLRFDGTTWTIDSDCRPLFPPTTELVSLAYVSGGGQQALADPTRAGLRPLAQPLQARVTNGQWPVAGASVVFSIVSPDAAGPVAGSLRAGTATGSRLLVPTDENGMASCFWTLDEDERHHSQRVVATLLEDKIERSPVAFDAQLNRASLVAYTPGACVALAGVRTVQDAIDQLCQSGADREPAVHIVKVAVQNGAELANDTDVGVEAVAQGIVIQCAFDQRAGRALNAVSINRATCYLTLELPYPMTQSDRALWGNALLGFEPLRLASQIDVTASSITLRPADTTATWLRTAMFASVTNLTQIDRILARLTLKGNFIASQADGDTPPASLDGDTFGLSGRERTAAILPSGDGHRGGDFEMWFWLVQNAGLADLVITPGVVVGGARPRVTVTLTGPAPSQGTTIQIFVDGDATGSIQVPNTVRVNAGAREASFDVVTQPVTSTVTASIRLVMTTGTRTESRAVGLTVQAPVADSLALNPTAVDSGSISVATVTLTGPAPTGGLSVRMATSDANATSFPDVPSGTVVVPAGQTVIQVRVATNPVVGNVTPTISATPSASGRPAQASLTIRRLTISGPTFNPTQVIGGAVSTGTLTLSGPAPANGSVVDLSFPQRLTVTDANGVVTSSIVVPAGGRNATFRAIPEGLLATTGLAVSATLRVGGATSAGTLVVTLSQVSTVALSPAVVLGGNVSTGTVTLTGPAPREGAVIQLSASPAVVGFRNAAGAAVSSVVVPAGGTSVTFGVATPQLDVGESQVVQVFANIAGQLPASANLTVRGPTKSVIKDNKDNRDEVGKIIKDTDNQLKISRDGIDLRPQVVAQLESGGPTPTVLEEPTGRAFITAEERPEVGAQVLSEAASETPPAAEDAAPAAEEPAPSAPKKPTRRARRPRQSSG